VLTTAGIGRIAGIAALLAPGATEFAGGNILLGGGGNDILEGRGGNDILDGDSWLNVQLRAVTNGGAVRLVNSMQEIRNDVFAGIISPSTITLQRSIVSGAAGTDTAVFSEVVANYDISRNLDGSLTVAHTRGSGADGVDRLLNMEFLRFSDVIIPASDVTIPPDDVTPPAPVSALSLAAADARVALSWTNPADAAGVLILRSTVGFATGFFDSDNQEIVYGGAGTDFVDTNVINGTKYYYTLFTWDAAGNYSDGAQVLGTPEAESTPDETGPDPVSSLVAEAGDARVTLTWTNPADATGVRVLRSTTGYASDECDVDDQVTVFDGPGSYFIDSGLVNGTRYFYTVFARDAHGNYSEETSGSATPTASSNPGDDDDGDDDDDDGDDHGDDDDDGAVPPPPAATPDEDSGGKNGCSATGSSSMGAAFGLLVLASFLRRRTRLTRG
jgi:uncharacterized protein (TIGR03382 family)